MFGDIKSVGFASRTDGQRQRNLCFDCLKSTHLPQPVGLYPCHGQGGAQAFVLTLDEAASEFGRRLWIGDVNFEKCVTFTEKGRERDNEKTGLLVQSNVDINKKVTLTLDSCKKALPIQYDLNTRHIYVDMDQLQDESSGSELSAEFKKSLGYDTEETREVKNEYFSDEEEAEKDIAFLIEREAYRTGVKNGTVTETKEKIAKYLRPMHNKVPNEVELLKVAHISNEDQKTTVISEASVCI